MKRLRLRIYVKQMSCCRLQQLNCFDINPEASNLGAKEATVFHHLVAKALFPRMRARPDTQLTAGFLCGRVKGRNVHDWKKLKWFF